MPTAPPMRVLLVEDVQLNQDLIREMLTRLGHDVMVAGNGLEALELCISERFDVVLMDIQMPVGRCQGRPAAAPAARAEPAHARDRAHRQRLRGRAPALSRSRDERPACKPVTWAALSKLLASLAEGELDETESVAASAAEAALLADPGTAPLIDRKMLASFSRNLSADEAAQFIGEAVEEAESG